MKMKYVKPVLAIESFELTQSIAHNCGKNLDFEYATLKYKGSCGWDTNKDHDDLSPILFVAGPACTVEASPDKGEGICYNNPEGGFNVFNS